MKPETECYLRQTARDCWLAGYSLEECLSSKAFQQMSPLEQRVFSNEIRILQAIITPIQRMKGYWA